MNPNTFVEHYRSVGASAIIRAGDRQVAESAMEAAVRGGFRIIEFTMTTPGAVELIAQFARREELVVGAGTVLTVEQAKAAVDAGARFLVSPVTDETVIHAAHELQVAVMPGAHTATEMLAAHRAGAQLQKLFPAPGTGPKYVRALLGPLPFLRIVPTNGVHQNNAGAYLRAGAHAVGFVKALFDPQDLDQGRYERIEQRAEQLLSALRS